MVVNLKLFKRLFLMLVFWFIVECVGVMVLVEMWMKYESKEEEGFLINFIKFI